MCLQTHDCHAPVSPHLCALLNVERVVYWMCHAERCISEPFSVLQPLALTRVTITSPKQKRTKLTSELVGTSCRMSARRETWGASDVEKDDRQPLKPLTPLPPATFEHSRVKKLPASLHRQVDHCMLTVGRQEQEADRHARRMARNGELHRFRRPKWQSSNVAVFL